MALNLPLKLEVFGIAISCIERKGSANDDEYEINVGTSGDGR